MGICVNDGRCLQQWAKAAMWAGVAWVRRMMDSEDTCLYQRPSVSTYTALILEGRHWLWRLWLYLFVYIEYKHWYRVTHRAQTLASRTPIPSQVTYLSRSCSFATSKSPSHPTSMRTFTPPSNSNKDWDAGEEDWAPKRGVNWNMSFGLSSPWMLRYRVTTYSHTVMMCESKAKG